MPDNILSVSISFVEHHSFTFPDAIPANWTPTTDPVRGPPRNKIIYVFQSIGAGPFKLFKAYKALATADLIEVSAADALLGKFPSQGPASAEIRLPDTLQQQTLRYFFYVSRTALDGSFLDDLARNPRPELKITNVLGFNPSPLILAVTDPLTVAEQLGNDYAKKRDACLALSTPFAEQSSAEAKITTDLLKQKLIAGVLNQLDPKLKSKLASKLLQQPAAFLAQQDTALQNAETLRDQAALECTLWLNGPLMDFVRSAYRAIEPPTNWVPDVNQLIQVEASVCALIADSYRGMCQLRTMIQARHYLMREFVDRRNDTASSPDLAVVQQVAKKSWDIVSKLWLATGGVMSALASRQGSRITVPDSAVPIAVIVRTYNTVFGQGILSTSTGNPASYKFRDPLDGILHDVTVTPEVIAVKDNSLLIALQKNSSSKNPFTAAHFTQGINIINLGLAISAAYEALLSSNSKTATSDTFFTGAKLLGGIVDTAAAFPRQVAQLLNLTGRGAAFLSLASAVIGAGLSFGDAAQAWNRGDHDAALGSAIIGAGGLCGGIGALLVIGNGGVITLGALAFTGVGLVLMAIGVAIVVLAQDSDMELFAAHCFLGDSFGLDSKQETWAPAPYFAWANANTGLDSQIAALFNLVFAFEISAALTPTQVAQTELTINFGPYFPGATFNVALTAQIVEPAGGLTPFAANLVIDPADPLASSGTGALENNAVTVNPKTATINIVALPRGLNPLSQLVSQVSWAVFMNLAENSAQSSTANPAQGFIVQVPGTVPTSKNLVVASGPTFGSLKSTVF